MSDQYTPPRSNVDSTNRAGSGSISSIMLDAMRGTKPWVLLIGIVLLISAAFMVLGTLGMVGAGLVGMTQMGPESGALVGMGIMYGVMSLIYILMGIYLVKYSNAIGRLLSTSSAVDMEDALESQRKFWKVAGIITAIMLVLMVIGIIAAIAIPFMTMGIH